MPWQKSYNETEVLDKAMRAFWARGYEATSMGDLVKATGINRGSMYNAFPSKHALFMRALKHYDENYRGRLLAQVTREYAPREAIIAVFEAAATRPCDPDRPWGCLIVNTALELSPHNPEVRRFVDKSFRAAETFFYTQIEAAKTQGTVPDNLESQATAKALLGLFIGLRVLTRANASQTTLDAVTSHARTVLT